MKQTAALDITPNGEEGAIWQSGAGPAADPQGYIYLLAANGTFDTVLNSNGFPSRGDFGNSFLKISAHGRTLSVADYFTMFNVVKENGTDGDLGSGGPMVLPDMTDASGRTWRLAVGAGKDHFGGGNKFITPMIANGKVYVGTTNGVGVFGLF
ncbi:MAG: hypothetical protein WAM39_27810 [Bryobacteraceae bacterium]